MAWRLAPKLAPKLAQNLAPKLASMPILALLAALFFSSASAPAAADVVSCDRASFGGFAQADKRDTRYWVLVSQATGPLTFRTAASGKILVERGTWVDPYSGRRLENFAATEVEIDHVVPVCWAWSRGASSWSSDRKRAFYNDRKLLFAVESGLNRQKGAMAPDQFVPMNRAFACTYIELFLEGVSDWKLRLSKREAAEIDAARSAACSRLAPSSSRPPLVRTSAG